MAGEIKISHYNIAEVLGETSVDRTLLGFLHSPEGQEALFEIKILKPQVTLGALLERIKLEGENAAKIRHPSLSLFLEVGFEKGKHFIVCETVEGVTLDLLISRPASDPAPIEPKIYLAICAQICSAYSTLEQFPKSRGLELDLIKDSLSTRNIKITFDGRVKIMEFGPFRTVENFGPIAPIGSSIFAFGALLWAYFNGQSFDFAKKHFESSVARNAKSFNKNVPAEIAEFVFKCLDTDSPSGFKSFVDVHADLQKLILMFADGVTQTTIAAAMQERFPKIQNELARKQIDRKKLAAAQSPMSRAPVATNLSGPSSKSNSASDLALPTSEKIARQFNVMNLMRTMMGTGVLFILGALWVSLAQRPGAMQAYKLSGLTKTTQFYMSSIAHDFKTRFVGKETKRTPASVHKVLLVTNPRIARVEINGEEAFDTITPTKIDFPHGDSLWLKVEADNCPPFSIIVNKNTSKITVDLKTGQHQLETVTK